MIAHATKVKKHKSKQNAAGTAAKHGLKHAVLTPIETLGQSIAGIAPSATPGMLIPIVFSFAGNGSWLAYLIATIGIILTASCINEFASRSACPGSLYSFVKSGFGPQAGQLTGWALMFAYIFGSASCATTFAIYASSLTKHFFGMQVDSLLMMTTSLMLVAYVAYKNIKMSATLMLRLEFLSMALILILVALTLSKFGLVLDYKQVELSGVGAENVRMGLVMAIFGFVAFESSASLGVEAVNPLKTIPRAIMLSVIITGIFFIISAYAMVMSFHTAKESLSTCATPLLIMSENIGAPLLGHLIDAGIMVSIFAAALANMTASSRMIYKMSHDGVFHHVLGKTHASNGTPHIAVFAASFLSLSIALILAILGCPLMEIVGWLGTLATFGFIYGYIATSLAVGKMLHKEGKLSAGKILIVGGSLLVLTLSLAGSLYPAPAFPYSMLPFIFAAYMTAGWLCCFKKTHENIAIADEAISANTHQ